MKKKVEDSQVYMSMVMLPHHANAAGNVHGGEIMKLMDNTASVVAKRHARGNVVTARVDELKFLHPCHIGHVVTCFGKLTFVGRTSMEVSVTVTVEDVTKDEPPKKALTAYFTFVALDKDGKPREVPGLEVTTEEEIRLYQEGQQRYLEYKKQKKQETKEQ